MPIKDATSIKRISFNTLHYGAFHRNLSFFDTHGRMKFGTHTSFGHFQRGCYSKGESKICQYIGKLPFNGNLKNALRFKIFPKWGAEVISSDNAKFSAFRTKIFEIT